MIRCRVIPVDSERPFGISELFFSITDEKGVILYGNETFQRISGYDFHELIGEPHNIIRHPDIPRCVFELLWNYLHAGKTIGAYVKNLAKDGCYYWVFTLVMPCSDGYVSIRLKPSSPIFPIVRDAYAQVVAFEQAIEDSPEGSMRQAIEQSLALTVQTIVSLGFSSYDEFMHKAFVTEMNARAVEIAAANKVATIGEHKSGHVAGNTSRSYLGRGDNVISSSVELKKALAKLSDNVAGFGQLHEELAHKSRYFLSLAQSINRLSLNAIVEANRLQDSGATLSVIAETLSRSSKESADLMMGLNTIVSSLIKDLSGNLFAVTLANLKVEMIDKFLAEIMSITKGCEAVTAKNSCETLEHNIAILVEVFSKEIAEVFPNLKKIHDCLLQAQEQVNRIQNIIMALHFVHFSGKVEASRSNDTKAFVIIFQEVNSQIDRANNELKEFHTVLQGHINKFSGLAIIEKVIWDNLAKISDTQNIKAWMTGFQDEPVAAISA